ncbi:hypothetical protein [Haladaptatus halobius]|uniref:hypothetical protein n=1 Tax=Haladaptatus halobius TaxID=2884875 RepID=UPI001D0AF695|nr:hypothetical protein [Haladaptatus halobius]
MGSTIAAAATMSRSGKAGSKSYKTITVSPSENRLIEISDQETFENVLIDITAKNAGVLFKTNGSGWTIRNVGIKGQHNGANFIMTPGVKSPNGHGLIENVYLGDGMQPRKSGGGIWVNANLPHRGTINVRHIHMANMVNNGLYASGPGTQGAVGITHVEDSYFRSNNISNIRMNAKGDRTAYVKNTVVEVDETTPPCGENCSQPGTVNNRGVWSWYGTTKVINSNIEGSLVGTNGGEIITKNTETGENSKTNPPEGVPMSAEEAAREKTNNPEKI